MNEQTTFPDEWLALAFAVSKDCPPPESYLDEVAQTLTAAERERHERHADECPACAAERDLARAFDAPEEGADVDWIVARLARQPVPSPAGRTRRRPVPAWALAAAAAIVVGVLGILRSSGPDAPALPAFVPGEVTRGTHIDVIQPVGDLDAIPDALSWRAVHDAGSYRVRLMRVDDSVLWEVSADQPRVALTAAVSAALQPRVAYLWQVEALGDAGERIALSDRARFRVMPSSGGTAGDRRNSPAQETRP